MHQKLGIHHHVSWNNLNYNKNAVILKLCLINISKISIKAQFIISVREGGLRSVWFVAMYNITTRWGHKRFNWSFLMDTTEDMYAGGTF